MQIYNTKLRRYNGLDYDTIILASSIVKTLQLSATWNGTGPYTQTITLSGYTPTANTKVDLQPDMNIIQQLINDEVGGLYIENNNGALSLVTCGNKLPPILQSAITFNYIVYETNS